MFIKEVVPSIIRDSRKERTIQIKIKTLKGNFYASAPSGKSKGKYETPSYNERGIQWTVKLLDEFAARLRYRNFKIRKFLDLKEFEDMTRKFEERYGKFGANATYALETAFLKAAARENNLELWQFILGKKKPKFPVPVGNCVGGGMHSSGEKPDFQEFLLVPKEKKFSENVKKNIFVYEKMGKFLGKIERKIFLEKNDENAWQTKMNNEDVLLLLKKFSKEEKLRLGIDFASSTFFNEISETYEYKNRRIIRDRNNQISYIRYLVERFNLFYLEDPLDEEDFPGFSRLKSIIKKDVLIVGDDLTATNLERIEKAVKEKCINAVIIKPNQNGYLLEVSKIVDFCNEKKIKMIFSHRSGETMDDALADYAIGFQANFIKTGIAGKERLIKLKRILDIERK